MAVNTWSSAGSTDGNLVGNWSLGAFAATDVLTFDATSVIDCTFSGDITCAGWNMPGGYSGTIGMNTRVFTCTGNWVTEAAATISSGVSLINLTGTAAQTFTSAGKIYYDITINRATAGTCLFSGATSLYTLTVSATNTQVVSWTGTTMTASGNITIDGTGTHNFGNGVTLTGASSNFHIGSTLTAPTASSCALTFNGTTACVWDDDIGAVFKSFTLGNAAKVSNTGSVGTTYQGATTLFTLGDGASYTKSGAGYLYLNPTATMNIMSIGSGCTLTPTGGVFITTTGGGAMTITLPALTIAGGGLFAFWAGNDNQNLTLAGNLDIGSSAVSMYKNGAGTTVFTTGGYSLTCGGYNSGGSVAGSILTENFGASVVSIGSLAGATFNTGTHNFNMGTSTWTCTGAWTFGSSMVVTGTASIQSVTFTNTSTITSNGKSFPGSLIINAPTKTITLAAAIIVSGNYTFTAGTLAGNFSTTCAGDVTVSVSMTFNRLILTKATTRTVTIGAGQTLTLTNLTDTNLNGSAGALTQWRSSVPGTGVNLSIPAPVTLTYQNPQDVTASQKITSTDAGSVNGGSNSNWDFPAVASVISSRSMDLSLALGV